MTAPTEAEIREALEGGHLADFSEPVYTMTSKVSYHEPNLDRDETESEFNRLWSDLRPTEIVRLRALIHAETEHLIDQFEAQVTEGLVRACLTFAAEYPDAPRAKVLQPA